MRDKLFSNTSLQRVVLAMNGCKRFSGLLPTFKTLKWLRICIYTANTLLKQGVNDGAEYWSRMLIAAHASARAAPYHTLCRSGLSA
jgi:hypothetical protein